MTVPGPWRPLVPNEPGVPAPAPAPASASWRDIRPELPCKSRATPGANISCAAPAGLATMSGSDGRARATTGPRPEG